MRLLVTLPEKPPVARLVAYLEVRGIQATLEENDGVWDVWVHHDDDREQAKAILSEFQADPDHERYAIAERKVRNTLKEANRLAQRNQADRLRKRWEGAWWHCYPATYIMIGLCIIVVLITSNPEAPRGMALLPLCNKKDSELLDKLTILPNELPAEVAFAVLEDFGIENGIGLRNSPLPVLLNATPIQEPMRIQSDDSPPFAWRKLIATARMYWFTCTKLELWRPIGPIFIHLSLLHILFNMMWLKNLGEAVEYVRGTWRFVLLCLIIAAISNLAQLYWSGPWFGGMSGVVFGLIGYVWMKGKTQPHLGIGMTQQSITFAILWLVLCMGGALGPIANAAHLVGFVVGILIGARQAIYKKLSFTQSRETSK